MKKTLSKCLVLLMLMTSVTIPTTEEQSARAATKDPELSITGGITKLNVLKNEGMAQEVGKTVTATVKNVKANNIKNITCYISDPRIATVTKKTLTKKKAVLKFKIKKLGKTSFTVRITLKKKQNGKTIWWNHGFITGVRKMTQKEQAALSDKNWAANTHSAITNKYGGFRVYSETFDEKGTPTIITDAYMAKDDMYQCDRYLTEDILCHTYLTTNTGFQIKRVNGTFAECFFINPIEPRFLLFPLPDDPEESQELTGDAKLEYVYCDDEKIYYSDVKTTEELWERKEVILDIKTYEVQGVDFYLKTEAGKVYMVESQRLYYGEDVAHDLYETMKFQFKETGKKKVTIEAVIDPGKPEERRISLEIPQGAPIYFFPLDGYGLYEDAEGKTPLTAMQEPDKDLTLYYIKNNSPQLSPR